MKWNNVKLKDVKDDTFEINVKQTRCVVRDISSIVVYSTAIDHTFETIWRYSLQGVEKKNEDKGDEYKTTWGLNLIDFDRVYFVFGSWNKYKYT